MTGHPAGGVGSDCSFSDPTSSLLTPSAVLTPESGAPWFEGGPPALARLPRSSTGSCVRLSSRLVTQLPVLWAAVSRPARCLPSDSCPGTGAGEVGVEGRWRF